jgi:hypothetical protein
MILPDVIGEGPPEECRTAYLAYHPQIHVPFDHPAAPRRVTYCYHPSVDPLRASLRAWEMLLELAESTVPDPHQLTAR